MMIKYCISWIYIYFICFTFISIIFFFKLKIKEKKQMEYVYHFSLGSIMIFNSCVNVTYSIHWLSLEMIF